MISSIGSIIKWLIVYRLLTNPQLETAVLCLSVLLLLFFGAFVKLKNGILSWICFFILLGIPVTLLTINIININLPTEDLQLSDIKTEQYISVTGDGIAFKRFLRRTVTEPLLGIQSTRDQQRIDDIVSFVQRNYPDGNISYRTSKKYSGIMLVDGSGKDLNMVLIRDGYVNIADKTPSQYLVAANDARKRGVGIWAVKVGMRPDTMLHFTFYIGFCLMGVILTNEYYKYKRRQPQLISNQPKRRM